MKQKTMGINTVNVWIHITYKYLLDRTDIVSWADWTSTTCKQCVHTPD